MKFSVLISVYKNDNPEHFKEAVESITLYQTLRPDQVVIVRDGPVTTELDVILEHFKSVPNIDILPLETNVGLSKALNSGLAICKHDYIARMDSDDISVPDRFEKQIDFMNTNSGISMLGGWYEQYDIHLNSVMNDRRVPENHEDIVRFAQYRTPFNHVTAFFNKQHIINIKGYPENISGRTEDWWLSLRLIKAGYKLHNLPEYLVKVRGGEEFLKRRGGLEYISWEIRNLYEMWNQDLITTGSLLKNLFIRTLVRLVNPRTRQFLYMYIRKFRTN